MRKKVNILLLTLGMLVVLGKTISKLKKPAKHNSNNNKIEEWVEESMLI